MYEVALSAPTLIDACLASDIVPKSISDINMIRKQGKVRDFSTPAPYIPITKHNTIVNYFIFSKIIMPDIQSCTAHPNCWHRLPSPPPPSTSTNPKHTSRTDHNILSLHLLLPVQPPLQSAHEPKTHFPPRQTFHAWKLKH